MRRGQAAAAALGRRRAWAWWTAGSDGAGPPCPQRALRPEASTTDLPPLTASLAAWEATWESEEMKLGARTTGVNPVTFPPIKILCSLTSQTRQVINRGLAKKQTALKSAHERASGRLPLTILPPSTKALHSRPHSPLPHYVLLEVQNDKCLDSRGENSVSCLGIRIFGTLRPFTHTHTQCFLLPASLSWRIFVEKLIPAPQNTRILPPLPPTLPRRLCVVFWFLPRRGFSSLQWAGQKS